MRKRRAIDTSTVESMVSPLAHRLRAYSGEAPIDAVKRSAQAVALQHRVDDGAVDQGALRAECATRPRRSVHCSDRSSVARQQLGDGRGDSRPLPAFAA